MNIIDIVILLFLLCGAVLGFKKGIIKSVVSLAGTIAILALSFYLKNPLSVFLYTYLPFFNFTVSAINILIYEGIAFLIVFSVLSVILRIIINVSGFIEFLLKCTIILAIPSKILGAIFGLIEAYVLTFIILFVLVSLNLNIDLITNSKFADKILSNTPIISDIADDSYNVIKEVIEINNSNISDENKNKMAIEALLKYGVVSEDNVKKLNENNKFNISDIEIIINDYKGE